MKAFRNILSLICISALLLGCIPFAASAMTIYNGDFGYEFDTYFHTAALVDYKGTDSVINIPEYFRTFPVTVIERDAFINNTTAEEIHIPSTVTTIKDDAFSNCTALQSITIPSTVTSVGTNICMNCTALESVEYLAGSSVVSGAFAGCASLTSVTLGAGITSLDSGAFARCTSLADLSFLSQITTLGDAVFYGNHLTNIELPATITTLPYYSFAYSDTLNQVLIPGTVTEIHPNAFTGSDHVVIYCYSGSAAHQFAADYSIPYVLLDAPGYCLGDVDGDNVVDTVDATWIQRHLALIYVPDTCDVTHADVDGDEDITIVDVTLIKRFDAQFEIDYPIGQWVSLS